MLNSQKIKSYLKNNISDIVRINLFLLIVFLAKIPDETITFTGLIKAFLPLMFLFYSFYRFKKRGNNNFHEIINYKPFILFVIFIIYCAISLTYSANYSYGFGKLLGLIAIDLPLILTSILFLIEYEQIHSKIFSTSIIIAGILFTLVLLFTEPFLFDNKTNILGFTHVGFGKYLSYAFLICLVLIVKSNKRNPLLVLSFSIITLGLFFSGLRAALLSVVLISVYVILRKIYQKKISLLILEQISVAILLCLLVSIFLPHHIESVVTRYSNLGKVLNFTSNSDSAIETRLQSYSISLTMIDRALLFGQGLGGFNQLFNNNSLPLTMKYPHNLFLEIASELGFLGIVIILTLLILTFIALRQTDEIIILLFINSLILSLFSGALPDQKFLFVFFSFLFINPQRLNYLKNTA